MGTSGCIDNITLDKFQYEDNSTKKSLQRAKQTDLLTHTLLNMAHLWHPPPSCGYVCLLFDTDGGHVQTANM